jgi:hypothetical protein
MARVRAVRQSKSHSPFPHRKDALHAVGAGVPEQAADGKAVLVPMQR